jgi:hypothetical protein
MDVSLVCRTARTLLVAVVVILGVIDGFSQTPELRHRSVATAAAALPATHAGDADTTRESRTAGVGAPCSGDPCAGELRVVARH